LTYFYSLSDAGLAGTLLFNEPFPLMILMPLVISTENIFVCVLHHHHRHQSQKLLSVLNARLAQKC